MKAVASLAEAVERAADAVGAERARGLDALAGRIDEIGALVDERLVADPDAALRLAAASASLWRRERRVLDGIAFLRRAVDAAPPGPSVGRARALAAEADLLVAAILTGARSDVQAAALEADAAAREAIETGEAAHDGRARAIGWSNLAGLAYQRGDPGAMDAAAASGIEAASDDPAGLVSNLHLSALAAKLAGDHDEARRRFARNLAFADEHDDARLHATELANLADLEFEVGNDLVATHAYVTAVAAARAIGAEDEVGWLIPGLAALAGRRGDADIAGRLLGAAERAIPDLELDDPSLPGWAAPIRAVEATHAATFAAAREAGRGLDDDALARLLAALDLAAASGVAVRRLDADAYRAALPDLAALLVDAVEGGASVNFLAGLREPDARAWWADRAAAVEDGSMIPFVAVDADGSIVGSTLLFPAPQPNGPHRAEVGKVLVLRSARRRGIARALMAAAEAHAAAIGRWLLVLDTHEGTEAEAMYRALGWTEFGRLPDHSLTTRGSLLGTVYFFKDLRWGGGTGG